MEQSWCMTDCFYCNRQAKQSMIIWRSCLPAAVPVKQQMTLWTLTWRQVSVSGASAASRLPSPKRSAGAHPIKCNLQSSSQGSPSAPPLALSADAVDGPPSCTRSTARRGIIQGQQQQLTLVMLQIRLILVARLCTLTHRCTAVASLLCTLCSVPDNVLLMDMCRAVRVRRFQSMSRQDILQYVIVGLLTGCFWWQRGGHDTLAASADTLGGHRMLVIVSSHLVAIFPVLHNHLASATISGHWLVGTVPSRMGWSMHCEAWVG